MDLKTRTGLRHRWWVAPAGVLAVGAAAAVIWAVLWPLTDVLATHDVGTITGPARAASLQSAHEAVRTQLITLGAGVFAAGALLYTGRNFTLSRQQLELSRKAAQDSAEAQRKTLELAEQGQVTERYGRAVEQLGAGTVGPATAGELRADLIVLLRGLDEQARIGRLPPYLPTGADVTALSRLRDHRGNARVRRSPNTRMLLPQWPEELGEVIGEQARFLMGGEVAAARHDRVPGYVVCALGQLRGG